MKKLKARQFLAFAFALIAFSSCMKNSPQEEEIPIYSNVEDIINPPDKFKIVFSLRTFNEYLAEINFESDAVWLVERISAPRSNFNEVSVVRAADFEVKNPYKIIYPDQASVIMGIPGGINYNFIMKKTSGYENMTVFIYFEKTQDTYDDYINKIDDLINSENP